MTDPQNLPRDCREAFELAMATEWKSDSARERALMDAVETFQEALVKQPANPRLWMHLGELQLDRGASREARRAFRQVLRIDPEDALAHSGLAYAYSELGNHAEAERLLQKAIELEPSDLLYCQLAALLIGQDRVEEAEAPLRAGLLLAPENAELLFLFARYLAEDPAEARAALERALCGDPENLDALFELGALFASEGELDRAAACFRRAGELEPERSEPWRELAAVELDRNPDKAMALAQRAVAADGDDARALGILSEAHWRTGDLGAAERELLKACAMRPIDADGARAHWLYSQLLEERGLAEDALITLLEVEPFIPIWPAIAADLGRLHLEQGELERADQYLHLALEHDTEDEKSRELLNALRAR